MGRVAAFPDPHSLARDELTSLLQELTSREEVVSDERRVLHAQIDGLASSTGDQRRLVVVDAFCRACVSTVSIVSMIEMVSSSGINELSTSPAASRRATSSA